MAGLQSLLEDYRNWASAQDWKYKKQLEQMFGGDPSLMEDFERMSGVGPSNLGGMIGAINIPKQSLAGLRGKILSNPKGYIDVRHTFEGYQPPAKTSIVDFQVDPDYRGQGVGKSLIDMAMQEYPDIGAQVSSPASLKAFYDKGFRNPELPTGSFEDYLNAFKDWGGSYYMKSPKAFSGK